MKKVAPFFSVLLTISFLFLAVQKSYAFLPGPYAGTFDIVSRTPTSLTLDNFSPALQSDDSFTMDINDNDQIGFCDDTACDPGGADYPVHFTSISTDVATNTVVMNFESTTHSNTLNYAQIILDSDNDITSNCDDITIPCHDYLEPQGAVHAILLPSISSESPPVTTAALSPSPFRDGTYSDPTTVTLSATAAAGYTVADTYYTIDGGSQQTYSSPFTVTGSGNHTVTYWSIDNNGVTETTNTQTFTITELVTAINAGGSATGNFAADTDYSGGSTYSSTASVDTSNVTNPAPQAVYQSGRYGNFSYIIPNLTANGTYTLQLHFNELYWGTSQAGGGEVGSRVFNVSVNGTQELSNFDIYQTAGGANKAVMEQVPVTADSNGNITIAFTSVVDSAMVNGIALYNGTLPSLSPTPTPTPVTYQAISAGGTGSGNFVADTDYLGGSTYSSSASVNTSNVTNPAPEAVYQNSRYGNFTYTLPTYSPNTNYQVRLHFDEPYWGTALSGNTGGVGSRVFNVSINGTQVLSNFDIYQTAGGANTALVEQFNTTSDSNGFITIHFTPVVDNAIVSGIEVSQQ